MEDGDEAAHDPILSQTRSIAAVKHLVWLSIFLAGCGGPPTMSFRPAAFVSQAAGVFHVEVSNDAVNAGGAVYYHLVADHLE